MPDEWESRHRLPGFSALIPALRALRMLRPVGTSPSDFTVDGISGTIVVERDGYGVPRVMADNMADVLYAQGYLHGRERGFQMDLTRRLGYGELGEWFGPPALAGDRLMRALNLRHWCRESVNTWSDNTKNYLDAYARGVNRAWQDLKGTGEWRILGVTPRPWTAADCNILQFLMGWMLNSIWTAKWGRHLLQDEPELFDWLFGPLPEASPTIIPDTGPAFPWGDRGFGSNGWVVGGQLTESGRPILANDPHLSPGLPSPWYLMVLEGGMLHAFGATLPGAPGIVLGQNQEIAWGMTNIDADVQNLMSIALEADGEHYRLGDRMERLVPRQEIIALRHRPAQTVTVWDSHWGPVLFRPEPNRAVALAWTGLQPQPGIQALLRLNRAHDWETFNLALAEWWIPTQNIVYADRAGHIGYVAAGKFPRSGNACRDVRDGNDPAGGWTEFFDWQDNPRLFDPPSGFIVTANQPLAGDGDGLALAGRHNLGFRARRIEELLRQTGPHDTESLAAIQLDVVSAPLKQLAAKLLATQALPPAWRTVLSAFDGAVRVGSVAPTLLYAFAMEMLPDRLSARLSQSFGWPGDFAPPTAPPDLWVLLGERLVPQVLAHWDDERVVAALARAERRLTEDLGADRQHWVWGRVHVARLYHPLGESRVLAPVFTRKPLAMAGDWYTPLQAAFSVNPKDGWPRRAAVTPSYRQILDLAQPERSVAIILPGQTGDPGMPHSDDMIGDFLNGRLHPIGPGMATEMWFTIHHA